MTEGPSDIGETVETTVYFNPDCRQSCRLEEILDERRIPYTEVRYLHQMPSVDELTHVLSLLSGDPIQAVRVDGLAALGLREEEYRKIEQVAGLLHANPHLLERPILVRGNRAIIARPAEMALGFLTET